MKKIYLLLILCACAMGANAQKEIYGEYDGTNLVIRYNEYRESRGGVTEWWGSQYSNLRSQVQLIMIDGSMNNARPTSTAGWFSGFDNLVEIVGMENLNTINTTDMQDMFAYSSKLKSIDLDNLQTGYVRNMSGMFLMCEALKELDLYSFHISFLQNTEAMFGGCSNLERIYCPLNWYDSDDLTNSQDMFYGCVKLKGGQGTLFQEDYTDKHYARPDKGWTLEGYFWTISDTGYPEGIENVQRNKVQGTKVIRDGQLLIERNGKTYNAQGVEIK